MTYSDLKKYKFYYWVAYPTLSNTWTVESESQETDTTITQLVETELDNEYGQFSNTMEENFTNLFKRTKNIHLYS